MLVGIGISPKLEGYFCTCCKDGHHQNCDFIGSTNEVENLALDVISAFLNSFLEISVAQLEGFVVRESEGIALVSAPRIFHPRYTKTSSCKEQEATEISKEKVAIVSFGKYSGNGEKPPPNGPCSMQSGFSQSSNVGSGHRVGNQKKNNGEKKVAGNETHSVPHVV
ncbi:hypothetical protein MTR67_001237 [Solanum verrucosum]|uniref:Uncharacterized protein n=1 Tax=Solanum verrucosum TaxID=315347 RepID=A0AAF0T4W9_SOLVR|nr:hypothetical protein MTR67_001237 [Solanum verrucosum]